MIVRSSVSATYLIAYSCHGAALFTGAIDPATGKSILAGKKITGFTTVGEEEGGVLDLIEDWDRRTIQEEITDAGATCEFLHSRDVQMRLADHSIRHPATRRPLVRLC